MIGSKCVVDIPKPSEWTLDWPKKGSHYQIANVINSGGNVTITLKEIPTWDEPYDYPGWEATKFLPIEKLNFN